MRKFIYGDIMLFKLKELREDNDLTQSDISNLLSITRQNYSRWETNEKLIPLKHLITLSNYYKVSLNFFTGLSKENNYEKITINKKEIGNRIKKFREINNISQNQLAIFLNTTQSTVSAYESGKTLILTAFAYQICKHYNISMDWLCGGNK